MGREEIVSVMCIFKLVEGGKWYQSSSTLSSQDLCGLDELNPNPTLKIS